MLYLGWYDDDTKKATATKISEGIERYEQKFGAAPNVCLVAEKELVEHPRVVVRAARTVRPNNFFIGLE